LQLLLLFATDASGINCDFIYMESDNFDLSVQRFHKPGVTGSSPVSATFSGEAWLELQAARMLGQQVVWFFLCPLRAVLPIFSK